MNRTFTGRLFLGGKLLLCGLAMFPCQSGCQRTSDAYRPVVETKPIEHADPAGGSTSPEAGIENRAAMSASSSAAEIPADNGTSAVPENPQGVAPTADPVTKETPKAPSPAAPIEQTPSGEPEATSAATPGDLAVVPRGLSGMRDGKIAAEPLPIKLLIPHNEFTREGSSQALRVTFDDLDLLKVCNMEPVPPNVMDYLPDWLKNLNGQKIILRGWMFPSGRQEGISSFMFVRDNGICCFGRDPKVYDKLAVTMQPGKTTHYISGRPFDVEATLVIEPEIEGPEEGLWWLYRLEGAKVIDSGK